jgi:sugar lactone lactonase YvrE
MGVLYRLLPAASAVCLLACSAPDGTGNGDPSDVGPFDDAGIEASVDTDAVVRWVPGVTVGTLAGSALCGLSDGQGDSVRFDNPVNVERSPNGELIVADFNNNALRRLDGDGQVSTEVTAEGFVRPFGLAFAKDGRLFAQTDGTEIGAETIETGALWEINVADQSATMLRSNMGRPRGIIAVDGGIVLADPAHHVVLWYAVDTDKLTVLAGKHNGPGFVDGVGEAARFDHPYGLALYNGGIAVADQQNNAIRRVTLDGIVSTIAGSGAEGMVDGSAADARFRLPQDLAADEHGNLYVADRGNVRVRRIDPRGEVTTVAGDGQLGFRDGSGQDARFFGMEGIDVRPDGRLLYVADGNGGDPGPYNRVRTVVLP